MKPAIVLVLISTFLLSFTTVAAQPFSKRPPVGARQGETDSEKKLRNWCIEGDVSACFVLADLYQGDPSNLHADSTFDVPVDYERSAKIFHWICYEGSMPKDIQASACAQFGALGFGPKSSFASDNMQPALIRACDLDSSLGCALIGSLFEAAWRQDGNEQWLKQARTYLAKGCRLGNSVACDIEKALP